MKSLIDHDISLLTIEILNKKIEERKKYEKDFDELVKVDKGYLFNFGWGDQNYKQITKVDFENKTIWVKDLSLKNSESVGPIPLLSHDLYALVNKENF